MARSRDRQFNFKNFVGTVLLSSLAMTAVLGGIRQLGGFEESELIAYDRFLTRRQPLKPDDRILVVGIDELDIQKLQEYPIHDGTLARLLKKLESYSPRAIGLDIVRDIPQGEGREQLTQVLQQSNQIVSACLLSDKHQPGLAPAPGARRELIGFANFPDDAGSIVRRSQLVSKPGEFDPEKNSEIRNILPSHPCNVESNKELLSFSFKLAQMYLKAEEGIIAEEEKPGVIRFSETVLQPLRNAPGGYSNLKISDYQILLNYRNNYKYFSNSSQTENAVLEVSLSEILNELVPESSIRGRIVLVGYTSPFVKDSLATPYDQETAVILDDEMIGGFRKMPGVVVHAQAISQILSAVLDERPLLTTRSETVEILWVWLWAIVGGAIAFHRRHLLLIGLLVGGGIAACWWSCWYLFKMGLWIPLVPTLWAIATTAIFVMLLNQARHGGYTQAIYEQLRDQLQGSRQVASMDNSASLTYLEGLVQRAQAIRREEVQPTELVTESPPEPSIAKDDLDLDFSNPEQQEIYNQIRAQVEEELLSEQQAHSSAFQQQPPGSDAKQIQDLIHRARAARQDDSSPPSSSD